MGSTRLVYGLSGLAINSKGEMYGASDLTGELYRIDAATGEAYFMTSTGLNSLEAIAFDRNDSLYGISNYDNALYLIDPASGSRRLIGPLGAEFAGLAFDPTDGTLWASQASGGIFTIDPTTATTTLVGSTGFLGATLAIEFDDWGNLFGTEGMEQYAGDFFIAIDKTTGAGKRIGKTGTKVITGLASRPGILEGPQISILHAKVAFDRVLVGTVSPLRSVALRSVGKDTLIVTGITDSGAPFLLSNLPKLPLILPPGSVATFQVAFAPSIAGDFAVTFSITSNDASAPVRAIELSGQAKEPAPPGSVLFASDMGSSTIKRLDPITFAVLDTILTPEPVSIYTGDIAYDGSSLFFHGSSLFSGTSIVHVLDPVTGQVRQSIPVPACGSRSALAHSGSSLFGVCSDYSVFELDPVTGLALNNFKPEAIVTGSLTFGGSRGTLFAYVNYSQINELNASTGAMINSFSFPDEYVQALAYSDHLGVLFASSSNGYIYGLNPDNGSVIDSCWAPVSMAALCADEYMVRTGAHLALGPHEMNFGKHFVGKKSPPKNLILRSIGTDTVTVLGLVPPGVPFRLGSLPRFPLAIPPMKHVEIEAVFSPTSVGPVESAVGVTSDDVDAPAQSTTIRGEGVAPPPPGSLLGTLGESLYKLDPTTAAGQFVGAIEGIGSITEIEFRSDGTLFGTTGGRSSKLITINVADGAPEIVAECCGDERCTISALEFDAAGRLYGTITYFSFPPKPTELVIIDMESGQFSRIDSITPLFDIIINGMTFGPDSTLYGVYSELEESYLITIDRFVGVTIVKGRIGFKDVSSLEFGPDGVLYGGTGDGSLITIDPKTGKGKLVGRAGFSALSGLAFYPHTEPDAINDATPVMDLPSEFALTCNYPNPFNPVTMIRFEVPKPSHVTITIYDLLGHEIRGLVDRQLEAGRFTAMWDGRDNQQVAVASGVYLIRMQADEFVQVRKMSLIR
ncbi:MAG: hypothetical protein ILNGONEN_01796 [Syntrophorhabdaceae bacterium]|nr:hypothetical protein [Syntrophorhabdaceae bacterium]